MNPDQQQYPIDYLNQIASQAPKKRGFTRKQFIIIIGAGAALLISIVLFILSSLGPNTNTSQELAARLIATQPVVSSSQAKIKNSSLRSLNSTLEIYLTNANRDITAPLAKSHIDVAKLSKTITATEAASTKKISDTLENARLNAVFDRTYAREISYQLDTIVSLMVDINATTKNSDLKAFVNTSYKNLQPIQKQFSDFNAANS